MTEYQMFLTHLLEFCRKNGFTETARAAEELLRKERG